MRIVKQAIVNNALISLLINKFQFFKVLIWIWNPLLIAHLKTLLKVIDFKTIPIQIFLKILPCSREKNSEIHILSFQSTSIILKTNLSSSSMISRWWMKIIQRSTITYLFRINSKQFKKEKLNSKLVKLQFKSSKLIQKKFLRSCCMSFNKMTQSLFRIRTILSRTTSRICRFSRSWTSSMSRSVSLFQVRTNLSSLTTLKIFLIWKNDLKS